MKIFESNQYRGLFFSDINFSRFRTILFTVVCSFALLMAACGDSSTGTNGGGDDNGNGEDPPPEPTFENVQNIFNSSCGGSGCHIGERTSGVQLDSYDNVMGSEGDQYGELVVQEGDANGSPLVDKIESSNPQFGDRMPLGGPYLSSDDINLIKDWIDEGAENN